ncbi:MAG TPA: SBBP repeat-containing protein [Candidatus Hydrogenedens sp.]|nr:SBBP repeat-containing protein [Candidatus Hydrogenedens sp.]
MQKSRLITLFIFIIFILPLFGFGNDFITSPLFFEANEGKFNSEVIYFSYGNSISVACYENSLVFFVKDISQYVKVYFPGGHAKSIAGSIPLRSYSAYFIGKVGCSKTVPHFKAITYQDLFPGIDLYLYEKQGNFEFDFIVQPGSNSEAISIKFESLDYDKWIPIKPIIDDDKIKISVQNSTLSFYSPYAYQWINGLQKSIPINLYLNDGVKFYIPENLYNPDYPLLIDPTLLAGTYLGGNDIDRIMDVKVDNAGNIYLLGETKSLNFPTSSGSFHTTFSGGDITGDVFIVKLNPLANTLIFSTFLGGSGDDSPTSIEIDSQRNIYIAGITSSSDFPITPNAFQSGKIGNKDGFITKVNSDCSNILYSSYIGGSAEDSVMDLELLSEQSVILTGWTQSNDFPIGGITSLNNTFSGGIDGFLTKFDSSFHLIWSGYIGTTGVDVCKAIKSFDNYIVLGGYTTSTSFPVTQGTIQTTYAGGNYDSFLMEIFDSNGSVLSSSYLGGSLIDLCNAICVDSSGNVYAAGETSSNNFPVTISSFQVAYGGGERDAFITKLNPLLNQIIFSSYLGGSKTESALSIGLDSSSRVYVVGFTYSGDFPVIPGTLQPTYGGNQDAFFSCLNLNGSLLKYSTFYGGNREEKGRSVYITDSDVMYIVGETASNILPITSGTYQTSFGGGTFDGFLACIDVSVPSNEGEGQTEGSMEGSYEGSSEGEGLRVWLVAPIDRTVQIGASTTFIVGISGYIGTVNYQWQFKGFASEEYISLLNTNSPMLSLKSIQTIDSGLYRCQVTDSQGTVISAPFRLNVSSEEGISEGITEGIIEGGTEGITEGTTEGIIEGTIEGTMEGLIEGYNEGVVLEGEGTPIEGILEGEGEGTTYPCGFEISGSETHSPLRDMAQNLYYITVPDEGILNDIIVNISLTHDDLRQVLIQLVSPQGTEVFLLIYPTQGGTLLSNTNFDDNAEIGIVDGTAPFTGSYKPIGYLGVLHGEGLQGTWTLRVIDSQTGGGGYLESWKLLFNTYACPEEGETTEGEIIIYHSADTNLDFSFSLGELLRVIQIFNYGGYHCDITGEDGFGLGSGEQNCSRHSSDYLLPYWSITLPELLRIIQLFNMGGYAICPDTEDGFCPIIS